MIHSGITASLMNVPTTAKIVVKIFSKVKKKKKKLISVYKAIAWFQKNSKIEHESYAYD